MHNFKIETLVTGKIATGIMWRVLGNLAIFFPVLFFPVVNKPTVIISSKVNAESAEALGSGFACFVGYPEPDMGATGHTPPPP